MVEWFPNELPFDLAAVIIVLALPIFVLMATLVFRARPGDLLGRRLAFFLLFHTLYQITWFTELFAFEDPVHNRFAFSTMLAVNEAATAIDAGVYIVFVATAMGWAFHKARWFVPVVSVAFAPLLASVFFVQGDWWESTWGTVAQAVGSTAWTLGFLYSVTRWWRAKGTMRRQFALYSVALGSKEIPFVVQTVARVIHDATGHEAAYQIYLWSAAVIGHLGLLVMALVLGYAILRHHMFDINVQLRWTVNKATLATFFVAIYSGISLAASEMLVDRFGYVFGALLVISASLAITSVRPTRRLADSLAAAAVPAGTPPHRLPLEERVGFYRQQVELAFDDGSLTPKELAMLEATRERLGLSSVEVQQVHLGLQA